MSQQTTRGYLDHIQCLSLHGYGLTRNTEAFWSYAKNEAPVLVHKDHDPLRMYQDLNDLPTGVVTEQRTRIPAYAISDLILLLPEVMICQTNGMYQISFGAGYGDFLITDSSLNNAIYQSMAYLLKNGYIDIKKTNQFLHYSIEYKTDN